MKTINSLSGGKTSSYMAAHYQADYNIFALITIEDNNCSPKDKALINYVSDKIGIDFIATAEDDLTLYAMRDLEQKIGKEIVWVSGVSFDNLLKKRKALQNKMWRFCTVEMKLKPIYKWWKENINETVEMRIGYRANETKRAKRMLDRCDENGIMWQKFIESTNENGRNKWKSYPMRKPKFPLIEDNIFKDEIVEFWDNNKQVPFAYLNNCVGCFHKKPETLCIMAALHPKKMNWFAMQEDKEMGTWLDSKIKYETLIL
jgi:hypothetical protein